jgi:hypothetical protein
MYGFVGFDRNIMGLPAEPEQQLIFFDFGSHKLYAFSNQGAQGDSDFIIA